MRWTYFFPWIEDAAIDINWVVIWNWSFYEAEFWQYWFLAAVMCTTRVLQTKMMVTVID